jgi:hypothetical protein
MMGGALARFMARGAAGKLLGELAKMIIEHGGDLAAFRNLVAKAAVAGDLDPLFEAYVSPTRKKLRDYVENG